MRQIAIVASRNFHPGHYSHVLATYKLLNESGMTAYMLLHPLFKEMYATAAGRILTTRREVRGLGRVDLLIVWFSSARALADIVLMRVLYGTKVIFVFHEPFESVRSYRSGGFGILKTLR